MQHEQQDVRGIADQIIRMLARRRRCPLSLLYSIFYILFTPALDPIVRTVHARNLGHAALPFV